MKVFEKLVGPLTISKLIKAHQIANNLSAAEVGKKLKIKGKKKFTLKDAVRIAKALKEDEYFYAQVWFQETARDAGLDYSKIK